MFKKRQGKLTLSLLVGNKKNDTSSKYLLCILKQGTQSVSDRLSMTLKMTTDETPKYTCTAVSKTLHCKETTVLVFGW